MKVKKYMKFERLFGVVISRLQKINTVVPDKIDDAMFLCQAPRPTAWSKILKWFRLANAFKRFPQNCLDQFESAQGKLSIGFNPVAQVFDEFGLENRITFI